MNYYVGLDVSFESTAICVIDFTGKIVLEASAASHADDLLAALEPFLEQISVVGLEAGHLALTLMPLLGFQNYQAERLQI